MYPHPPSLPQGTPPPPVILDPTCNPLTPFPERIWKLFHQPFASWSCVGEFPGHLHIDLLPEAQGGGWGRKLMAAFEARLKELGCPAYHLGVGKRNEGAVMFYRRYGMLELEVQPWGFVLGRRL